MYLPFSPTEITTGNSTLREEADALLKNNGLRSIATALYQDTAKPHPNPALAGQSQHPNGYSWSEQQLVDAFNAASPQRQDELIHRAATKQPILLQYDQPTPATVLPGPGDTVFIEAHGSHTDNLLRMETSATTLTPDLLLDRMRESQIPDGIAKLNFQSCGGSNQLHDSFQQACTQQGRYPDTEIITYGQDQTPSLLIRFTQPLNDLDKGMHAIIAGKDEIQLYQEYLIEEHTQNLLIKQQKQLLQSLQTHMPPSAEMDATLAQTKATIQKQEEQLANQRRATVIDALTTKVPSGMSTPAIKKTGHIPSHLTGGSSSSSADPDPAPAALSTRQRADHSRLDPPPRPNTPWVPGTTPAPAPETKPDNSLASGLSSSSSADPSLAQPHTEKRRSVKEELADQKKIGSHRRLQQADTNTPSQSPTPPPASSPRQKAG
ncbi:hypothetical protein SAMN02745166_02218 [Prosthecobacter debontii]|uniref:Uncharacterized protein n=2 Tax=Prosthecobacter debontii TaxID=48467 RepID=A0A1T4XZ52_9BACT|nr:hypothetical protein SAMN02745166_02218 [Prosthecobacter debontii]